MSEIEGCRKRLSSVRQQVLSLEEQLATLRKAENTLDEELERLVLKKIPIDTMPNEVLREIFRWTLPMAKELALSTEASSFALDSKHSPIVLRHVNKKWRAAAQEYPLLWGTLRLCLPRLSVAYSEGPESYRVAARYIRLWLDMSPLSPLKLQIWDTHRPRFAEWLARPLLQPFSTSDFGRIINLSLCGVRVQDVDSLPHDSFHTLEDLALSFYNYDTYLWHQNGAIEAFSLCPNLKRVALANISSETLCPTFLLPWNQLSHLLIRDPVPMQFFEDCMGDAEGDVEFPFFSRLDLKALKTLRLSAAEDMELSPAERTALIDKFKTMQALAHLSLDFHYITKPMMEGLLKSMAELTVVELRIYRYDDDNVFSVLTLSPSRSLLPKLITIILDVVWDKHTGYDDPPDEFHPDLRILGDPLDTKHFLDFIQSRRNCPAEMQLQKLIIYTCAPSQIAPRRRHVDILDKLKERGLEVDIRIVPSAKRWQNEESWFGKDREFDTWPEVRDLVYG